MRSRLRSAANDLRIAWTSLLTDLRRRLPKRASKADLAGESHYGTGSGGVKRRRAGSRNVPERSTRYQPLSGNPVVPRVNRRSSRGTTR